MRNRDLMVTYKSTSIFDRVPDALDLAKREPKMLARWTDDLYGIIRAAKKGKNLHSVALLCELATLYCGPRLTRF